MKRSVLWSMVGAAALLAGVAGYRLGTVGERTDTMSMPRIEQNSRYKR